MNIKDVINEYFEKSSDTSIQELKTGAINQTFHLTVVKDKIKNEFILQKMKLIFDTSMMEDIDFITKYLSSKEFSIQKVIPTLKEEKFVKDDTSWWRLLTYIPGKTYDSMPSLEHAKEAGKLLGEFHNTLIGCDYKFKFLLPNFRDTKFVMNKLKITLEKFKSSDKYLKLKDITQNILTEYDNLPKNIFLPKRIIHGDLKFSNILFDESGEKALTLIDLDSLMQSNIAIELGDALRSWCMPGGEDVEIVKFDLDTYKISLDGYNSTAKFLTLEEKNSIPYGVKLVTLELAARFVIDAFEENYWVLNSTKYKNLFEQNKKKAENQLKFYKEFSKVKIGQNP